MNCYLLSVDQDYVEYYVNKKEKKSLDSIAVNWGVEVINL